MGKSHPNIIIHAGTHAIDDPRIQRSARAAVAFADTGVVCQRQVAAARPSAGRDLAPTRVIEADIEFSRLSRLKLPRYKRWASDLAEEFRRADLVYVHDSGLSGLLFAVHIKRTFDVPVVFDYHDSLEYELCYQLAKVRINARCLLKLYTYWAGGLVRHLDGVVGVSEQQIQQLFSYRNTSCPYAIAPNVRPQTSHIYEPREDKLEFMWIGNLTRPNNIERIVDLLNAMRDVPFTLTIAGAIVDEAYRTELEQAANFEIRFSGRYESDDDLLTVPRGRVICIIPSASDPWDTKIDAISSPNKAYSAINLGIPLIVERTLTDLVNQLTVYGAGVSFDDAEAFRRGVALMDNGYVGFRENVARMRHETDESSLDVRLTSFLSQLLQNAS